MNAIDAQYPGTRATLVRTLDGFEPLRTAWDALIEASENGCLFARWDWIRTWFDVFGNPGMPLAIVCVWRGEALIGVAPFWVQTSRRFGMPIRTLRFLGTGEAEADEVLPEYLDIVCRTADRDCVAAYVASALNGQIAWDTATFSHMLPGSVLETALRPLLGERISVTRAQDGARYRLQWAKGEMPHLPPAVSAKQRKLQRAGSVQFECANKAADLDAAFEILGDLHAGRWRNRGTPGVFASDKFVRFHRTLAALWAPQGFVCLRILRLDGRPVAALLNFCWRDVEYFYQSGVDTQHKGLSPGLAAHAWAIEESARSGATAYDFLGGETDSYKRVFGAPAEPLVRWTFYTRTWRARIVRLLAHDG
jgi:CelD/BcsL family acetyltransferase involved in cellulose biosynthesis